MNRKFSKRETVLLLILVVLLIGLFYYYGVWNQTEETIASYNTMDLEDEYLIQETRAKSKEQMEAEMESGELQANGVVASYNNITNEINALNDILADSDDYTLEFVEAEEEAGTVRRDIKVSFHSNSLVRTVS